MFLILDQQLTEFSRRLKNVAERKGLETLVLTSAEIARDLVLVFHLSDKGVKFQLSFQGTSIESHCIDGVYCGINAFEPKLWDQFSSKDAEYAAWETQALWLAILASLPCQVVNPPALDTMAGTLLSTPEILYFAHRLGFQIPAIVSLESGKVTAELLSSGVTARYADLGDAWISEKSSSRVDLSLLEQKENHFRVTEEIPGRMMSVALVGSRFFACALDSEDTLTPITYRQIPRLVRTRLRTLHKWLNLNVAEYYFHVTAKDTWIFSGCGRPPTLAVTAFGDAIFEHIINFAVGKGK
ncbi:MAG: hypothetical protein PVF15_00190 [Candidatus Bathyarchaeota archaeon]